MRGLLHTILELRTLVGEERITRRTAAFDLEVMLCALGQGEFDQVAVFSRRLLHHVALADARGRKALDVVEQLGIPLEHPGGGVGPTTVAGVQRPLPEEPLR